MPIDSQEDGFDSAALDTLWSEITDHLSEGRFRVFPSAPVFRDAALTAFWPDDDWRSFLEIAAGAGVALVFAERAEFRPEDLEDFGESDGDEESLEEEEDELRNELRSHLGSTHQLHLAFVADGVLLQWLKDASWWHDAVVRNEQERRERYTDLRGRRSTSSKLADEIERRAEDEGWARLIAEDGRYREAGNLSAKYDYVTQFLVEHDVNIDSSDANSRFALFPLRRRLARSADELFVSEIQPKLEDAAMEMIPQFYDELSETNPAWSTATTKTRESLARRFLRERYGFPMPAVVGMLARHKPEGPPAP